MGFIRSVIKTKRKVNKMIKITDINTTANTMNKNGIQKGQVFYLINREINIPLMRFINETVWEIKIKWGSRKRGIYYHL